MKLLKFIGVLALFSAALSPAQARTSLLWNSQTQIKGTVTIPVGETVTVAPHSVIKLSPGSQIVVNGELLAPGGLTLVGTNWNGLIVVGSATISAFNESGAMMPFRIAGGGKLTIHGGTISGVNGSSEVEGLLIADGITYNKGSGIGISSNNGTADISINHSTLLGAGRNSGDFFGIYGAKSITLTNSQMTGAHCAFHVMGLQNMKLINDNIHDNSYGFMMYGSSTIGTRSITNTSIANNNFGFDEGGASTKNGVITISHSYIKQNGQDLGLATGKVLITQPLAINPFARK